MKDYANRMWPKVLVNSQTKRVFVFYDYQGSLGENIIMMATRPPGSTIFVNERKVLEKAYLDISRPILTEEKSTSSLLQLYWRDVMTNTAYRSVSKSSGLYWEPAEKLVNSAICGPAGKDLRLFKVVGAQAISTNSLVAVCGKLGEHYYARISHNQGKDWEATMTEIPTRTIHEWDVCPNGNEAFLLVHIEGADGKPKIGKLWLSSGKYEEKAYPTEAETKLVARVGMGCISKDGRVRMMLEELEGQKWVQRAYDDSDNLSE